MITFIQKSETGYANKLKEDRTHPIPLGMLRRDIPQFTSILYYNFRENARIF